MTTRRWSGSHGLVPSLSYWKGHEVLEGYEVDGLGFRRYALLWCGEQVGVYRTADGAKAAAKRHLARRYREELQQVVAYRSPNPI